MEIEHMYLQIIFFRKVLVLVLDQHFKPVQSGAELCVFMNFGVRMPILLCGMKA